MEVKGRQRFFLFENVKPPPALRLPSFRRFTVLDDDAVKGVCVLQKLTGNLKIWRLFVHRKRFLFFSFKSKENSFAL